MANSNENNVNGKIDPGELPLFRCKYCSQTFHPEIAFDLHVMAKHPTQWGTQPFYPNSGVYSLASADLLKIVQREFGSLRRVTLQDVKSSVPPVMLDPPKWAKNERSIWRSTVKRRLDADHDDRHSENESLTNGLSPATRGRKIIRASSSTSAAESIGADLPTTSSAASTSSTSTLSRDTAGTPSNDEEEHIAKATRTITTYVAKSVLLSRQNRGKPYYVPARNRQEYDRHDRHRSPPPAISTGNSDQTAKSVEYHAFCCFPKHNAHSDGAFYVYQPTDTADLLNCLTWKTTKVNRQKQEAEGDESVVVAGDADRGGFSKRRKRGQEKRRYSDGLDDSQYSYNPKCYYNGSSYNHRVRSGFIYDARMNRVQAESDSICASQNALHLYLFKSPAGDVPLTKDEVFGIKGGDGKGIISKSAK